MYYILICLDVNKVLREIETQPFNRNTVLLLNFNNKLFSSCGTPLQNVKIK